jgi:hypothetical protein
MTVPATPKNEQITAAVTAAAELAATCAAERWIRSSVSSATGKSFRKIERETVQRHISTVSPGRVAPVPGLTRAISV